MVTKLNKWLYRLSSNSNRYDIRGKTVVNELKGGFRTEVLQILHWQQARLLPLKQCSKQGTVQREKLFTIRCLSHELLDIGDGQIFIWSATSTSALCSTAKVVFATAATRAPAIPADWATAVAAISYCCYQRHSSIAPHLGQHWLLMHQLQWLDQSLVEQELLLHPPPYKGSTWNCCPSHPASIMLLAPTRATASILLPSLWCDPAALCLLSIISRGAAPRPGWVLLCFWWADEEPVALLPSPLEGRERAQSTEECWGNQDTPCSSTQNYTQYL